MNKKNNLGQATIEYVLVLSLLLVLVATMVNTINKAIKKSAGSLAYTVSQHLTVGICEKDCFTSSYNNY